MSLSRIKITKQLSLVASYVLLTMVPGLILHDPISFLWAGGGLALAVVLIGGYSYLPAVFLGAVLGKLLIGESISFSLLTALRHAAGVFIGIWLLKKEGRFDINLGNLGDFLRILTVAWVTGMFSALVTTLLLPILPLNLVEELSLHSFNQRWMGHALGVIIVMPLMLVGPRLPRVWISPYQIAEAILIISLSFLVGQVVFVGWLHDSLGHIAQGYWMFLFITWAALRLGTSGAVLILAVSVIQGLYGAQHGLGFFSDEIAKAQLLNYFFYTLCLALVGMSLATYMAALKHHEEHLDEKIETRTAELVKARDVAETAHQAITLEITRRRQAESQLKNSLTELQSAYLQLQQTQSQLLQAEKMASIGQLAAGVAHEINNPIAYVYSNISTLQNYLDGLFKVVAAYEQAEPLLEPYPEAIESLCTMKTSVDFDFIKEDIIALISESREGIERVKAIVQNLKDFSHTSVGDEWQWSELHHGLDSTLNIAWNEIKFKATVNKEYGYIPKVECLPSQLNQVFMNLMINAAQAIEESGTITLRTGIEGDKVWIEIADTGKGIAQEHLSRIFDPFFTTKAVGKGTGLGLSVSYSIIETHHGNINVISEVGKGTTFRITLPVAQSRNESRRSG